MLSTVTVNVSLGYTGLYLFPKVDMYSLTCINRPEKEKGHAFFKMSSISDHPCGQNM